MSGALRLRADLYRVLARLGFTPQQIDGMEVWQVATLLGTDQRPDIPEGSETFLGRPLTEADKRRLEKARLEPEDSTDITDRIMREMGIVTE